MEPDQIDMMSEDELRTELRRLAIPCPTCEELRYQISQFKEYVKSLEQERDRYKKALEKISESTDCWGPGCPYCCEGTHPLSSEAKLAKQALEGKE